MPLKTSSLFIPIAAAFLLGGCGDDPPRPDYTPFADGLKALGICLVVSGVVRALADLIMASESQSKDQPSRKPRKPRDNNEPEGK